MNDQPPAHEQSATREADLLVAYRHDAHKLNGRSHAAAVDQIAGVRVNQSVPYGADRDAAALSRPSGEPTTTVDSHTSPYRLSLVDGESRNPRPDVTRTDIEHAIRELLSETDPEDAHHAWLTSDLAARFNEAVSYPYTSLKYHTLLVVALLDNYRDGHAFSDLRLVVDDAETIVPHRTVFAGDRFALRITATEPNQPFTGLGDQPRRSWASIWTQLPTHPIDTDHATEDRILDANLRRIRSWSTALQYIEEYGAVFDS
ncbi:hypothetical protein [Halorubrum sp. CGM4_25_10-8A]|uniref:hypothetical protein n=1 Tax=Halorubrum sp. CGM4_25_10-8A TaxID=2518116 RepID=UPI0010F7600D|nr:hypothetical protein [Halorubrum sp. CGM4_25_10-8A]TKX40358.1 hypothetical protein EXE52_06270 [Halorubrum sp. CGM4_25_10-8A]